MYEIEFQLQLLDEGPIPYAALERAIVWVLQRHGIHEGASMVVVLAGDELVRRLNRQFRQVDSATDVLSFPAGEPLVAGVESAYLGDLVISVPYTRRQAEREGHSAEDELVLAVVHGTLHLLGYDHDTPEKQQAMWRVQAEALAAMQVDIEVPEFEVSSESHDANLGEGLNDSGT